MHVISLYGIIMLTVALDSGFGHNRNVNLWSICLLHAHHLHERRPNNSSMVTTLGISRLHKWKCCKTWAKSFGNFLQPPQTRLIGLNLLVQWNLVLLALAEKDLFQQVGEAIHFTKHAILPQHFVRAAKLPTSPLQSCGLACMLNH